MRNNLYVDEVLVLLIVVNINYIGSKLEVVGSELVANSNVVNLRSSEISCY